LFPFFFPAVVHPFLAFLLHLIWNFTKLVSLPETEQVFFFAKGPFIVANLHHITARDTSLRDVPWVLEQQPLFFITGFAMADQVKEL